MHFNFSNPDELKIAEQFRNAEIPFKIYNAPNFDAAVDLWTPTYLNERLKRHHATVEKSKNNHFMFFNGPGNA
jgi:hypothetical protein